MFQHLERDVVINSWILTIAYACLIELKGFLHRTVRKFYVVVRKQSTSISVFTVCLLSLSQYGIYDRRCFWTIRCKIETEQETIIINRESSTTVMASDIVALFEIESFEAWESNAKEKYQESSSWIRLYACWLLMHLIRQQEIGGAECS